MSDPGRPPELTHVGPAGQARQVDVGEKPWTERTAEARGFVRLSPGGLAALHQGLLRKGDPLQVARIAGIQAAKRTSELIPLCHPVPLTHVEVEAEPGEEGIELRAVARARWHTGVEMEALTAVAAAALTIYDMLKAVDRGMTVERVRLTRKTGGRSGDWLAPEPE